MIVVDSRWSGQNGIGRYATEVLSRLSVPWAPIEPSGSPSSPSDFLTKSVKVGGLSPSAVYSPGYNGFLRSVPQTITLHDLIHLQSPGVLKYKPYYNLFLKPLIKRNRHVITVSETSKRHIEEWINDPAVDVVNAGNASSPAFTTVGGRYSAVRPYFLYVGNLRAHKNVETIVRALKLVDGVDLFLVTSDRDGAKALAARHDVVERVRVFSGLEDEDLACLYRGARATLQPSLLEGFGLPALEAALCGSPVIFFEGCDSVREICAGGGHAIPQADDARSWAARMSEIKDHERFPTGHIESKDFTWSKVADAVSTTIMRFGD
ncbi:glycosyltransferase family 4 protein [Leifsonia sp. A12D58]|uniref:glycosyltransferase family 4 protein n=1 Tax=Leifsonia sp. A12D58 TaxID=3397674 RepID=UPI0039E12CC8